MCKTCGSIDIHVIENIRGSLPCNELLGSPGTHLHQGGLFLCSQIHRLLWVEVRPQRRLIILQFVFPWLQCVLKRLQEKIKGWLYLLCIAILLKLDPLPSPLLPRAQPPYLSKSLYSLNTIFQTPSAPSWAPLPLSHPVSGEHLSSVFVLDLDDTRRLNPGLTIHLNGNPLITQDSDLHSSTLFGQRSLS